MNIKSITWSEKRHKKYHLYEMLEETELISSEELSVVWG
jgi:hypothetical protein